MPGGDIGGIIASGRGRRSARPHLLLHRAGHEVVNPQRPTVHALDMDTGAIVWQNTGATGAAGDASFGPVSAVPGVVIVGSVITPHLRMYDARSGALVADHTLGAPGTVSGIASGAAVLDGTLLVGAGIGTRTSGGSSPGDFAANTPSALVALCVPGTPGCTPPTLQPGGVSVVEGNSGTTAVAVPFTLSRPIGKAVTVEWTTLSSEAESPVDFVAASGRLTFAALETQKTVTVLVNGDTLDERDETFLVSFRIPPTRGSAASTGSRSA